MRPLVVLLTNFELEVRGGSQLYLRDVALGLLGRGHTPVAYSPKLGAVARELTDATVAVTDDLRTLTSPPDVIHGQHNHELFTALLRFPGVPAVRVCHGWRDDPPQLFPRVLRYVAVDDTTRDRCVFEWGVPAELTEVLLNFVDTRVFANERRLPQRPARALVFSNRHEHVRVIRSACRRMGMSVDAVGHALGNQTTSPERLLADYDLVFAKGRSALEALASGAAVVLCDVSGLGPMVTSAELSGLRRLNFGIRTLRDEVTVEGVLREVDRYDPQDAAAVTARIRKEATADGAIDRLVEIYRAVIHDYDEMRARVDAAMELRAASDYLHWLAPRVYWSDSPRAAAYTLLRRVYTTSGRVPGVRTIASTRWVRRLTSVLRNWRQRASETR